MIKKTRDLEPGDVVYVRGERVTVEMVSPDRSTDTYNIRHSSDGGWFKSDARWLVEEPLDDVVRQAEQIATGT